MNKFEAACIQARNELEECTSPLQKEIAEFRAKMWEIGAAQNSQFHSGQMALVQPVLERLARRLPEIFISKCGATTETESATSEILRLLSDFTQQFGFTLSQFGKDKIHNAVSSNLDLARFDAQDQIKEANTMLASSKGRWAMIFNVMVASPSDVEAERDIVKETINDWNSANAERTGVVFLVKRWEDLPPSINGTAQDLINSKILESADWLIAIFFSRIGKATDRHLSGTTEEIVKHAETGKHGMVYFSEREIPHDHDPAQLAQVRKYKEEFTSLYKTYSTPDDFRAKFLKDFNDTAYEVFCPLATQKLKTQPPSDDRDSLSTGAHEILEAAADDPNGIIMCVLTRDGTKVIANGRDFNSPSTARGKAKWMGVLESLEKAGFIEDISGRKETYSIKNEGYEYLEDYTPLLKLWATISANYSRVVPPGLHPPHLDVKPSYELTVTATNNGRERITIISCDAVVDNTRYGLFTHPRGHVTLEPNTAPAIYSSVLSPEILGSIQEIILLDGRGESHRVPRKVVESIRSGAAQLQVGAMADESGIQE